MRKSIVILMALSALSLAACVSSDTVETTVAETVETTASETVDEGIESFVGEEETDIVEETGSASSGSVDAVSQVVVTTATYHANAEEEANNYFHFENEEMGEFICNVSDITDIESPLSDGETYEISHSQVMAMSYPGILSQVYAIRPVGTGIIDTYATLDSVDENAGELLFTAEDGNQFLTTIPDGQEFEIGNTYIVSHDGTMTRSMPGRYMNVTRIIQII